MARLPLIALLCLISPSATAQWSKDPLNPQVLAGGAEEQGGPRLVAGPGGSQYLTFFDDGVAQLQRIDAAGRTLWPAAVTLGPTSLVRLAADPNGNAWISVSDVDLTVLQFDADGNQVWSLVITGSDDIYQHALAVTETGHGVVAWADSTGIVAQRLDPLGIPEWDPAYSVPIDIDPPVVIPKSSPNLEAVGGDAVVLSWASGDGVFFSEKHLHAQKLSAAGTPLWLPDPVEVFEKGSLWGGVGLTADGLGGAYFSYHDLDPFTGRVQRVLADGTQSMGILGEGANLASMPNLPGSAHIALRPETNETYVVWNDKLFLDGEFTGDRGYSAQKFAPDGTLLWGTAGVVCSPVSATDKGGARIEPLPHGVAVTWLEDSSRIRVLLLDENGTPQGGVVELGDAVTSKSAAVTAEGAFGDLIALWSENDDLVGQNLTPSGNFGPAPGAVFRTLGPNPHSYTASVGPLGSPLNLSVDLTTTGHAFALLVAYTAPAVIPLAGPQSDFALVLPLGPEVFNLPLLPGPVVDLTVTIPTLPILCGVTLYTQAAHIDGALATRASNAQDLYFGI